MTYNISQEWHQKIQQLSTEFGLVGSFIQWHWSVFCHCHWLSSAVIDRCDQWQLTKIPISQHTHLKRYTLLSIKPRDKNLLWNGRLPQKPQSLVQGLNPHLAVISDRVCGARLDLNPVTCSYLFSLICYFTHTLTSSGSWHWHFLGRRRQKIDAGWLRFGFRIQNRCEGRHF